MGLDQYLYKKVKEHRGETHSTGACGGLFPLAPATDGMIEIGYWRKAYKVNEAIMDMVFTGGEDNCVKFPMSKQACMKIMQQARAGQKDDTLEDDEREDWKQTEQIMKTALHAIQTEDAEIFYEIWY